MQLSIKMKLFKYASNTYVTMKTEVCPVVEAIKVIGTKWRLVIIRYLLDKPKGFNELKKLTNASSRTLSRTLYHLIAQNIVERKILQSSPISVEYNLTKKGKDLNKILEQMGRWSKKWKIC